MLLQDIEQHIVLKCNHQQPCCSYNWQELHWSLIKSESVHCQTLLRLRHRCRIQPVHKGRSAASANMSETHSNSPQKRQPALTFLATEAWSRSTSLGCTLMMKTQPLPGKRGDT